MHSTKQDLENMQQRIDYPLNEKMLDSTKLPLNTQKADSFNRAIISKAPKSKTFTRNRSQGCTVLAKRLTEALAGPSLNKQRPV